MTKDELQDKADWEGGVFEVIDYGIKAGDLPGDAPPAVVAAWLNVQQALEDIEVIEDWLWGQDG